MQKERSMNDSIEIKLTEAGIEYLEQSALEFSQKHPYFSGERSIYRTFIENPESWHKVQLHKVINMFDNMPFAGMPLPFTWRLPPEPFTDHECVDG